MKQKGIPSWMQRENSWAIDPHDRRFLQDALAQSWAPKSGRVAEIGCGTAPILRWFCKKGYSGVGIDISETALEMAREQSVAFDLAFHSADFCKARLPRIGRFAICVDGRFLHCITSLKDRETALANVKRLLEPGGVFLLMTMCSPVHRSFHARYAGQRLIQDVLHAPSPRAVEFSDMRRIDKKPYLPMRYIAHWKKILLELRAAGFTPRLIRVSQATEDDPVSSLNVAALLEA